MEISEEIRTIILPEDLKDNEYTDVIKESVVSYVFTYSKNPEVVKPVEDNKDTAKKDKQNVNTGIQDHTMIYVGVGLVALSVLVGFGVKKVKEK